MYYTILTTVSNQVLGISPIVSQNNSSVSYWLELKDRPNLPNLTSLRSQLLEQ